MQTDFPLTSTMVDSTAEKLEEAIIAARAAGHYDLAASLEQLANDHFATETAVSPNIPQEVLDQEPQTEVRTVNKSAVVGWPVVVGVQTMLLFWLGYLYRTGGYSQAQLQLGILTLLVGGGVLLGMAVYFHLSRKQCWPTWLYLALGVVALGGKAIGLWPMPWLLVILVVAQCGLVGYLWRTSSNTYVHSFRTAGPERSAH